MTYFLLPWPLGLKGTNRKWGHLTVADMRKQQHWDALRAAEAQGGNIGAAQGKVSNDLCSVDADSDAAADWFLTNNPNLAGSLITKGKDGVNVWVRMIGGYPSSKKFKINGSDWGEWRADGNQTIIFGQHPSGCRYRVVNRAKPSAITFSEIVWPPEIQKKLNCTETTEPSEGRLSNSLSLSVQSESGLPESFSVESIVDRATPTQTGTNNERLFVLARGAKTLEKQRGQKLTKSELDDLFDLWFARSSEFLNPTGPHQASKPGEIKTDYRIEFLRQYQNAKVTLDLDTIDIAWKRALSSELPSEALRFDGPTRMAVALCRELQRLRGTEPIFVPTRKGAKLLGVDSNRTVGAIFQYLAYEGILELVEKGGPGSGKPDKSNRYFYKGKI